jgi:hypothetical protein
MKTFFSNLLYVKFHKTINLNSTESSILEIKELEEKVNSISSFILNVNILKDVSVEIPCKTVVEKQFHLEKIHFKIEVSAGLKKIVVLILLSIFLSLIILYFLTNNAVVFVCVLPGFMMIYTFYRVFILKSISNKVNDWLYL